MPITSETNKKGTYKGSFVKKDEKNKKDLTKSKIINAKDGGFGKYSESTGGGHPFQKGNSNTRTTRENGKLRNSEGSSLQPRTSDGKFTYNSVNGKGLKYESRGETVNPLLTGGENGIKFDEQSKGFSKTKWEDWASKHQWWKKGAEIVGFDGKIKISGESLMKIAREYDPETKMFKGEDVSTWATKKGRHGKSEKEAIERAKTRGTEGKQFVEAHGKEGDKESGIKTYGLDKVFKKKTVETPTTSETPPTPEKPVDTPTTKTPIETKPETPTTSGTKTYPKDMIEKARDYITRGFGREGKTFDSSKLTDEYISDWLARKGY